MFLYHYYDAAVGPFVSLSDLPVEKAEKILQSIRREKPNSMCAKRHDNYLEYRRTCEEILRTEFGQKNGKIERISPHYMVIGYSRWLHSWYENGAFIKIPIEEFDLRTLSFTYGDSMPTFSKTMNDGKEYRRNLYTYEEIVKIIEKYGLPQEWNEDGKHGPERYIEVQVWSDEMIARFSENVTGDNRLL